MGREPIILTTRRTSGYHRQEFDVFAPIYDPMVRFFAFFFGGEKRLRKKALGLVRVKAGSRILDIGCGTGTTTLLLLEKLRNGGPVVGMDISPGMLNVAKRKAGNRKLLLFRGNAEDVPCPDGTFDFVTLFFVLHEMTREGRRNVLREIHRILRPRAKALICDYHLPNSGFGRLLLKLFLLVERKTAKEMVRNGLLPEVQQGGFSPSSQRLLARGPIQLTLLTK